MKKLIIALSMIMIASSSYALELYHATILKHRSWIDGKSVNDYPLTGHIENKPFTLLSSATVRARTHDVSGLINTNIQVRGTHSYYIRNTSGTNQIYVVDLKLCANLNYCFHDQTHIRVTNMGYFSNIATSSLTSSFVYAGEYPLEATTHISGETSSTNIGRATIHVRG